jgi:hypothetical protein
MADHPHTTPRPDEHPPQVTPTEARQGTGPRSMFSVLTISLALAAAAGSALLAYFLA